MLLQYIASRGYFLAESPLINDRTILSLKDRGCYPSNTISLVRLFERPASRTYGSNTNHPPIFTPRTISEPKSKSTLRFRMGLLWTHISNRVESALHWGPYAAANPLARITETMLNSMLCSTMRKQRESDADI